MKTTNYGPFLFCFIATVACPILGVAVATDKTLNGSWWLKTCAGISLGILAAIIIGLIAAAYSFWYNFWHS